ncbi:hypothetical protein [Clostridium beijerinckii]|nr:hypothetical protein [Clostridium beijerinckii]
MHNICPDEFYGVERNDMAKRLILAFSSYEVEQTNKKPNSKARRR